MGEELKPPIILIGNVRSGTSMTRRAFGMHPEVVTWDEPRTIWMYPDPSRAHDRFDASDATPRVKRYIRRRFLKHQRRHEGLRVMEKTPSNVLRIPLIREVLPESKLLYIVRDPLANLASSEKKWQGFIGRRRAWSRLKETPKSQLHYYGWKYLRDNFEGRVLGKKYVREWGIRYPGIYEDRQRLSVPQIIAKQWVASVRQVEADLANVDPALVYRTTYERVVTNPREEFISIFRHFDLEPVEETIRQIEEKTDAGRRKKWMSLEPRILAETLPILEEEMTRHGYEIPDEAWEMVRAFQEGSPAPDLANSP
jgi:hypothetical protein